MGERKGGKGADIGVVVSVSGVCKSQGTGGGVVGGGVKVDI